MTVEEKIVPLSEEFTDRILHDPYRNSILLSIHKDHFKILFREFKKLGYSLVHASYFKSTDEMTVLFMREGDK